MRVAKGTSHCNFIDLFGSARTAVDQLRRARLSDCEHSCAAPNISADELSRPTFEAEFSHLFSQCPSANWMTFQNPTSVNKNSG